MQTFAEKLYECDKHVEKIFPSILPLSLEEVKQKTFIDMLNRLKELEIVDKTARLKLRGIRNQIAHEHLFNADEVIKHYRDL